MPRSKCPFCELSPLAIVAENDLAFAIRDRFPVRPLHTLVIPKRHIVDVFDSSPCEREALHEIASRCRSEPLCVDASIGGFNFGSNIGEAAGQKIFHAHIHLIPRRAGDTPPPLARPDE